MFYLLIYLDKAGNYIHQSPRPPPGSQVHREPGEDWCTFSDVSGFRHHHT